MIARATTATTAAWQRLQDGTLLVKVSPRGVRVLTTLSSGGRTVLPRPMRLRKSNRRYLKVDIWFGGTNYSVLLHRLVWMSHHREQLDESDQVDHRDRNRENCRPSNLIKVPGRANIALRDYRNGNEAVRDSFDSEEECAAYYAAVWKES